MIKSYGRESAPKEPAKRPNISDVIFHLIGIFTEKGLSGKQAENFIHLVEPMEHHERPYEKTDRDGEKHWVFPYQTRLINLAKKYVSLTELNHETIRRVKQEGFYWRGDDMESFKRFFHEYQKMKKMGVENYRQQSKSLLKNLFRKSA